MNFEKGDVIQHKSGGGRMVVTHIIGSNEIQYSEIGYEAGDVVCEWRDEKGYISSREFHSSSLQKYST